MAFIKDYYTESGQHFIQVTPQEKGWIPYQAAMICVQKPEWLPPCERLTEQEGILYNVTDCICIQTGICCYLKVIHQAHGEIFAQIDKIPIALAILVQNA